MVSHAFHIRTHTSVRSRFYEAAVEGRSLRSSGGLQEEEEEESGEEEPEEGKDYSWKKTIMIGPSYQVPVLVNAYPRYRKQNSSVADPDAESGIRWLFDP